MKLIGMLDSPAVRRVAIPLQWPRRFGGFGQHVHALRQEGADGPYRCRR